MFRKEKSCTNPFSTFRRSKRRMQGEADADDQDDDDSSLPALEPIDGSEPAALDPQRVPPQARRPPPIKVSRDIPPPLQLGASPCDGGFQDDEASYDTEEDGAEMQPPPAPRPIGLFRVILGGGGGGGMFMGDMADEDEAADIRQALAQSEAVARRQQAAAPPAPIGDPHRLGRHGGAGSDAMVPPVQCARVIPTFWHACQGSGGHCPGCAFATEYVARFGRELARQTKKW